MDVKRWDAVSPVPAVYQAPLYSVTLNGSAIIGLVDSGATHSFVRKDWAESHGLKLDQCTPRSFTLFDRSSNHSSTVATTQIAIGSVSYRWTFIVIAQAPYALVIGLDLIRDMLLPLAPRDLT